MNTYYIKIFILICVSMAMLACNHEDPNPELRDPIYQDFAKQRAAYEKAVEDGQKTLETAIKGLESTEARTLDRKISNRAVEKAKDAITLATQKAEYYKIRAELRKAYGRREYKIAFKEGKPWPDPAEFEAYKVNKALVEADRSWSSRVPKTTHQEMSADQMKKAPEE